jgi:hypothetical protein
VEEAWRTLKSALRLRPVYHWAPHRIHAHVALSVLALLLERVAEHACADTLTGSAGPSPVKPTAKLANAKCLTCMVFLLRLFPARLRTGNAWVLLGEPPAPAVRGCTTDALGGCQGWVARQ